jgi:hypothetical protein
LPSALDGAEWSASRPGRFTPDTRWIESWVGPTIALGAVVIIHFRNAYRFIYFPEHEFYTFENRIVVKAFKAKNDGACEYCRVS